MEALRERIDIIDESMQNLFLERMQVVKEIAEHKLAENIPVFDAKREADIIAKNLHRLNDTEMIDFYRDFYQKLLEISKKYQERIINNNHENN